MLDSSDIDGERLVITNPYFELLEPTAWDEGSTYVRLRSASSIRSACCGAIASVRRSPP